MAPPWITSIRGRPDCGGSANNHGLLFPLLGPVIAHLTDGADASETLSNLTGSLCRRCRRIGAPLSSFLQARGMGSCAQAQIRSLPFSSLLCGRRTRRIPSSARSLLSRGCGRAQNNAFWIFRASARGAGLEGLGSPLYLAAAAGLSSLSGEQSSAPGFFQAPAVRDPGSERASRTFRLAAGRKIPPPIFRSFPRGWTRLVIVSGGVSDSAPGVRVLRLAKMAIRFFRELSVSRGKETIPEFFSLSVKEKRLSHAR